MSIHRCNHCDMVFDTQKPSSGTVLVENHAASDCPGCGGKRENSRALMSHHLVVDDDYRAIPDRNVRHVPALPVSNENNAQIQEMYAKLQQQLDAEKKRGDEMQRSMDRLAAMPLRETEASKVVEPPAVGESHLAQVLKQVEAPAPASK